ncbi:DUF1440 domain-containing protein, partial [Salmonella enterica subsp. enterica]
NGYECWSEMLGPICWSVAIEVSRIATLALLGKKIEGVGAQ